jgi:M6 family metalloprotease-like protein
MATMRINHRNKTPYLIRLLVLSVIFSLAPVSFIQQVSAAPIPVSQCKLADQFNWSVRLGFPKDSARLSSTGPQKVLLLAIDYADAPTTDNATDALKLAFDTDHISEFYKSVSYGQLSFTFDFHPTVVRMPKPSSSYVGTLGNTFPQPIFVSNIVQDAARAVSGQVNFSSYQAVAILDLSRIEAWGYWGFAIPDGAPGFQTTTGYIRNSTVIGAWENTSKAPVAKGYKTSVLKHEIGHLFGFIDLYIIAPGNYFIGQTPGPFDVMNATSGSAHEFLAWQRWLQGWITDANVTCLSLADPTATMQLKPLGKATTGTQMAVLRISAQKALVLESRKGTATDELSGNDGLLVYEIDLSVPSLQGPIKIIPKNTPTTLAPLSPDLSDTERYLDATAQTGEYIRYKDVLIENKLGNDDGESIQIFKGDAAIQRQRELDAIERNTLISEFNQLKKAKASNTYYESPTCIYGGQKFVFQTLDSNRVWKDLDSPIGYTTDPNCSSALNTKPYIIAQLPSRTFYRGKITNIATKSEWFTPVVITDVIPLNDQAQIDLEIALAKLEDNYIQETTGCYSKGTIATLQIEKAGVWTDFAGVTSWVPAKECTNSQSSLRPYVITRLNTGTKYRFKAQAGEWDRDYFSKEFIKGKTAPEQLADVKTELTSLIDALRTEKSQLEGSITTLKSQLIASTGEIEKLQATLAAQKSNFESISGELITAKSKLEGDVALLKKENITLKNKVGGTSKTTITCVKGKTQKKVTAVKPVCPSGYTKKN